MSWYKTQGERQLWLLAALAAAFIFLSLLLGRPLQQRLWSQDVQVVLFLAGMLLTAAAIIVHGIRSKASGLNLVIWLGLLALGVMVIFRLGAPERSHLMEYSILAILIHRALDERHLQAYPRSIRTALYAFSITTAIGIVDEVAQIFIPARVFDINDIFFNGIAAFLATFGGWGLGWLNEKVRKSSR